MEKVKKKWGSPRMEIQRFTPQEYCDVCGPTETDKGTLYAQCVNGVVIKFVDWQGKTSATGTPEGQANTEKLYYDSENDIWAFFGTINEGHDYNTSKGEFMPATTPEQVGTQLDNYTTYCNHKFETVGYHHHLTNGHIVYVNHS